MCAADPSRPSLAGRRLRMTTEIGSPPLEEIRSDVGFLLDRVIVAIDAVGDQRVACTDVVLVELDRVQPDDSGFCAGIPFERGRALRLFAARYRFGEDIDLEQRLERGGVALR